METEKGNGVNGFPLSLDFQTPLEPKSQKVSLYSSFEKQSAEKEEISEDHVPETKYTMQSLCKSFIKKYAQTDIRIEPSLIAVEFNAKLRRVYDLTNILEGGGIIQKVEKGIYKWRSNEKENQLQIEMIKNDWCSLRGIAFEIKKLFKKMKKGLTCNDLYQILINGNKNRFNPATIRRKIYECCKVFVIVGLIQKTGKYFYSSAMTKIRIQSFTMQQNQDEIYDKVQQIDISRSHSMKSLQSESNERQGRYEGWQNYKSENPLNLQQRKAIIRKIVNQIENQSDLNKFIQDLNQQYQSKKMLIFNGQNQESVGNCCHQNQDLLTKDLSPRSTPQLHKNIILSSPLKDHYTQFFGSNSNSCFFPSNLETSTFELIHNIKGK